jgi:uncharacterized protein (TIGR02996 family)
MNEDSGRQGMTPQERGLLAEIAASPDDDAPRLVYADWLEERGDLVPAAFLQYQVAAARSVAVRKALEDRTRTSTPPAPAAVAQVRQEREHRRKIWLERGGGDHQRCLRGLVESLLGRELPADAVVGEEAADPDAGGLNCVAEWSSGHTRCRFLRGFLVKLNISADDFLGSPGLITLSPVLSEVTFRAATGLLAALAASPLLTPAAAVRFEGEPFSAAEVRSWLTSPYLGGLRRLQLPVDAEGAAALAAAPEVSALEELTLRGPIGDAGAAALAASNHLSALKKLDLEGTGVGDAGAAALAASRGLGGVEDLNLGGNPLGEAGLAALASPAATLRPARLGLAKTGCCPYVLGPCPEVAAATWDEYRDPFPDEEAIRAFESESLRSRLVQSIIGRFSWPVKIY